MDERQGTWATGEIRWRLDSMTIGFGWRATMMIGFRWMGVTAFRVGEASRPGKRAGATAPAIRGLEALLSSADSENRASIGFRKE